MSTSIATSSSTSVRTTTSPKLTDPTSSASVFDTTTSATSVVAPEFVATFYIDIPYNEISNMSEFRLTIISIINNAMYEFNISGRTGQVRRHLLQVIPPNQFETAILSITPEGDNAVRVMTVVRRDGMEVPAADVITVLSVQDPEVIRQTLGFRLFFSPPVSESGQSPTRDIIVGTILGVVAAVILIAGLVAFARRSKTSHVTKHADIGELRHYADYDELVAEKYPGLLSFPPTVAFMSVDDREVSFVTDLDLLPAPRGFNPGLQTPSVSTEISTSDNSTDDNRSRERGTQPLSRGRAWSATDMSENYASPRRLFVHEGDSTLQDKGNLDVSTFSTSDPTLSKTRQDLPAAKLAFSSSNAIHPSNVNLKRVVVHSHDVCAQKEDKSKVDQQRETQSSTHQPSSVQKRKRSTVAPHSPEQDIDTTTMVGSSVPPLVDNSVAWPSPPSTTSYKDAQPFTIRTEAVYVGESETPSRTLQRSKATYEGFVHEESLYDDAVVVSASDLPINAQRISPSEQNITDMPSQSEVFDGVDTTKQITLDAIPGTLNRSRPSTKTQQSQSSVKKEVTVGDEIDEIRHKLRPVPQLSPKRMSRLAFEELRAAFHAKGLTTPRASIYEGFASIHPRTDPHMFAQRYTLRSVTTPSSGGNRSNHIRREVNLHPSLPETGGATSLQTSQHYLRRGRFLSAPSGSSSMNSSQDLSYLGRRPSEVYPGCVARSHVIPVLDSQGRVGVTQNIEGDDRTCNFVTSHWNTSSSIDVSRLSQASNISQAGQLSHEQQKRRGTDPFDGHSHLHAQQQEHHNQQLQHGIRLLRQRSDSLDRIRAHRLTEDPGSSHA